MLKFKSRKKFIEKLQELDKLKISYTVDMVKMIIWNIESITDKNKTQI